MAKLILSLDGGGIRGAASARFLAMVEQELQSQYQTSIRDHVDFYAGTSTGSIIALALATTNMTMNQISELYNYETAQQIFAENEGWFEIDGINAPKFEGAGKTQILKENLGEAKISDVASDKHVLAVSYDIERRQPVVIKSTKEKHQGLYAYQVADVSSAAPTIFRLKPWG